MFKAAKLAQDQLLTIKKAFLFQACLELSGKAQAAGNVVARWKNGSPRLIERSAISAEKVAVPLRQDGATVG